MTQLYRHNTKGTLVTLISHENNFLVDNLNRIRVLFSEVREEGQPPLHITEEDFHKEYTLVKPEEATPSTVTSSEEEEEANSEEEVQTDPLN